MTKRLVVATLLAFGATAHAQPAQEIDHSESSYRDELIESDLVWIGATAGAFAVAGSHDHPAFVAAATVAGATYALSGSFVHVMHGHVDRAIESAALRVGAPVALGALGLLACECRSSTDGGFGRALVFTGGGVLLGAVVGNAIDVAILGRGSEGRARAVTPYAAPTGNQGGMSFGFTGSF